MEVNVRLIHVGAARSML